jgi:hypothetical protein
LITHDLVASNECNRSLWPQNWFIETKFQFGDYVLWFLGAISKHAPKFQKQWLGPYQIQYCLPHNTILLVTIDKNDPNPVLVNSNKFKPYKFIEDKPLQPILVKFSDLVTYELVQTKEPIPLLVKPKDFQPIGFEQVSNHLTHGNIKATDVLVQHYHNLPIWDNNVAMSNDANDMFGKAFIDVYLLGVSNLKSYVHS